MKYNSVNEIGLGESVLYEGKEYLVLINYIKGETDAKGYTPNANRTILIDNDDTEITCLDYTQLEVIEQITDHGRLI